MNAAIALDLAIIAVTLIALVIVLMRRSQQRATQRILRDFVEAFPGRCPLCSFARHHMLSGGRATKPAAHHCPEGNSTILPRARVR